MSIWRHIRDEFPVTRSRAYLFAGGMAPLSRAGRAAIDTYLASWTDDPTSAYQPEAAALRESIARLINCDTSQVAIVDSTSRGNHLAVSRVAAGPGTNVVVDSTTYPTALEPWHARRVEVRTAGSPGEIAELVDKRTVAVSVSHVCRLTGFRHDLADLSAAAHAVGASLLVDAAQSAGVIPIDVKTQGIDFLAFGAMKWLLGAPGVAFFYDSDGAGRHELNSLNWPMLGACQSGLDLLARAGAVEQRVTELAGRLIAGLRERGVAVRTPHNPGRRAGVVAFEADHPAAIVRGLREHGVDVWGWEARRLVRVDPHVYNDPSDIERFFAALDAHLSDN